MIWAFDFMDEDGIKRLLFLNQIVSINAWDSVGGMMPSSGRSVSMSNGETYSLDDDQYSSLVREVLSMKGKL